MAMDFIVGKDENEKIIVNDISYGSVYIALISPKDLDAEAIASNNFQPILKCKIVNNNASYKLNLKTGAFDKIQNDAEGQSQVYLYPDATIQF